MKRTFATTGGERFTLQGRAGCWTHEPSGIEFSFGYHHEWHWAVYTDRTDVPFTRLVDALDKYAPAMRKAEAGARQWFRPSEKRPPKCEQVLVVANDGMLRVAWLYHGEWWFDAGLERQRIDPPQWWQPIVLPGVEDA